MGLGWAASRTPNPTRGRLLGLAALAFDRDANEMLHVHGWNFTIEPEAP